MTPYYDEAGITIYHGDCREVLRNIPVWSMFAVVTDPPYPNNAGYFEDSVETARDVLMQIRRSALVFWTELEQPPVQLPLVGVHIWHRSNVNGRPYEPIYHFDRQDEKRRSEVLRCAVPFENATGSAYAGHPTQKPVAVMERLVHKCKGVVLDPFMGVGSTLLAAKNLGRSAIGIEMDEQHCEIAALRLAQGVFDLFPAEDAS